MRIAALCLSGPRRIFDKAYAAADARLQAAVGRLRFRWKMAVAPACTLLVMVMIGAVSLVMLSSSGKTVRQIVSVDMATASNIAQANATFLSAQADLYRLTTNYAGGSNEDPRPKILRIQAKLALAREELLSIGVTEQQVISKGELCDTAAGIDHYSKVTNDLASSVEIDFAQAIPVLVTFDGYAQEITAQLASMTDKTNRASTLRGVRAATDIARANLVYGFGLGLAVILGFLASWIISREIIASVNRIIIATDAVAEGDDALDLSAFARSDELGSIIGALVKFRAREADRRELEAGKCVLEAQARRSEDEHRQQAAAAEQRRQAERVALITRLSSEFDKEVNAIVETADSSAQEVAQSAQELQFRAAANAKLTTSMAHDIGGAASSMQIVATATQQMLQSTHTIVVEVENSAEAVTAVLEPDSEVFQA